MVTHNNVEKHRRKTTKVKHESVNDSEKSHVMRMHIKEYAAIVSTDERYLCMPFEPEKGSYLSLLSHELCLKIFWKACAGENYDRMSYVCHQLRQLPLCPLTEWIREMEVAVHPVLKARSVYPPQWTPFKKREFNQVYTMPRAINRSSSCSHCHHIMDHHLSVGLSSAVYRLLHPSPSPH